MNDLRNEGLYIGDIDFKNLMYDQYILSSFKKSILEWCDSKTNLNSVGMHRIIVYGSEGNIPHFYIQSENFDCCIMIYNNEYITYGSHKDILLDCQSKALEEWMNQDNRRFLGLTNWEVLVMAWEFANPDSDFKPTSALESKDLLSKKPDYSTIKY